MKDKIRRRKKESSSNDTKRWYLAYFSIILLIRIVPSFQGLSSKPMEGLFLANTCSSISFIVWGTSYSRQAWLSAPESRPQEAGRDCTASAGSHRSPSKKIFSNVQLLSRKCLLLQWFSSSYSTLTMYLSGTTLASGCCTAVTRGLFEKSIFQ